MVGGKANVSGWWWGLGQMSVSATCIILSPMGHVNDGGESRHRRGFATGAVAAFGGGGVGRCVGGDLLWRAERVRAMVREGRVRAQPAAAGHFGAFLRSAELREPISRLNEGIFAHTDFDDVGSWPRPHRGSLLPAADDRARPHA